MPNTFKSLLPTKTPLEAALEETLAKKYQRVNPEIINLIQDPWQCPVDLLPWLAYAYSVDVWDDGWPEQVKRPVIHNAIQIHKHKGTIGGLEDALQALGITIRVLEWFEKEPEGKRGTVEIVLSINDNCDLDQSIDSKMIRQIIDTIRHTKRHSIHFTFIVDLETSVMATVATSAQATTNISVNAKQTKVAVRSDDITIKMACTSQLTTLQRMSALANKASLHVSRSVSVALSAQCVTLTRLEAKVL